MSQCSTRAELGEAITREPTALFVNTASRTGQESYEAVRGCLGSCGATLVESRAVDEPHQLSRMIRAAVDGGIKRVLVGGGDGTLSMVAGELIGKDVRMGVLPLGTGNDFARSLGIPATIEAACRAALGGEVRRIDVGLANQRAFLNAASIGLSSAVTRRLSDDLKKKLGRAAFAVVAAGEAFTHQPFRVTLEIDGKRSSYDTHQVVVGNGRYHGGGNLLSPEASHEDAQLDIWIIGSAQDARAPAEEAPASERMKDLWNLFRVATMVRRGRHIEHPSVLHLQASRVRVEAEPPQEVDVDGELMGETPVDFEVLPGALQVLVPPPRRD